MYSKLNKYVIIYFGEFMIKVKCDRLDHFGRGICFIDGKIVFVNNLLPDEEAYIEIIKNKSKYSVGKIISLESMSKDRTIPNCPYMNCGCALKHLKYEKQLEFKEKKVFDIIKRYGKINPKINKIISSEKIYNYRNKVTLKVNGGVGYFENDTNNIIKIDKCFLVSDRVNKIINVLNSLDLSEVNDIIIKDFDEVMIIVNGKLDIKPLFPLADSIYVDNKLLYGGEFVHSKIKDLTFNISKDSFFQVNSGMIEKLYDIAIGYLGHDKNKKVLDLYCGTGTIALLLSKYFKEVIGVEINKEAIHCANLNKKTNNIDNVNFICGDVSLLAKDLAADYIVVDPPRSGLSKEGVLDILKITPEKIVYISCDPMTLARDLRILSTNYDVKEITPVDMFPNTYHVECVCLLERRLALIKQGQSN